MPFLECSIFKIRGNIKLLNAWPYQLRGFSGGTTYSNKQKFKFSKIVSTPTHLENNKCMVMMSMKLSTRIVISMIFLGRCSGPGPIMTCSENVLNLRKPGSLFSYKPDKNKTHDYNPHQTKYLNEEIPVIEFHSSGR